MSRLLALTAVLLAACAEPEVIPPPPDDDGDGFDIDFDCDDTNPDVFPGADELCGDLVDNNCDGRVDEDEAVDAGIWHPDVDGDGFGGPLARAACEQPEGYILDSSDCDDDDPWVSPIGLEICDGVDNDCDGFVDQEGALDAPLWYGDADDDGFGDPGDVRKTCLQPDGYVGNALDCDPSDGAINPDADEIWYDDIDQDCDGASDHDADGDGFDVPIDCDDTSDAIFPGAVEVCDEVDNDCDTVIDEPDAEDALTWYRDFDGDEYGNPDQIARGCTPPEPTGWVDVIGDCADRNEFANPDRDEVCGNNVDDDCSGQVDDPGAVDATLWYPDEDRDGYGDMAATGVLACAAPPSHVSDSTDCNDDDFTTHPGAAELCDGKSNDCDGEIDEDPVDAPRWYADRDGDLFGDPDDFVQSCSQPAGEPARVSRAGDCDDVVEGQNGIPGASINPDADELCGDGVDNNCVDGADEDSAPGAVTWYIDLDGDGYGTTAATVEACGQPRGFAIRSGDCDETSPQRASVHPGATEVCDNLDNDCNDAVDDNAIDQRTYYRDLDGDGWGLETEALRIRACEIPIGYVPEGYAMVYGDCNEANALVHPDALEVCDGLNNDCDDETDEPGADGEVLWYLDFDGDGWGDQASETLACDPPDNRWKRLGGDCNDALAEIKPFAPELCDGVDNDCSGLPDDGLATCPCPVFHHEDVDGVRAYQLCDVVDQPAASDLCAAQGWTLVTVDDAAENASVQAALEAHGMGAGWLGYTLVDGTASWEVPQRGDPYDNFGGDTADPGEACAIIDASGEGPWSHVPCDDSFVTVCEAPE